MPDTRVLTRGERTRQAILDAAQRLFLENGYNGTSMRQIAHAAGIALGGIYNHFNSKEDIFRALLQARIPNSPILGALDSIVGNSGPEMLNDAFTRLLTIARENIDIFALVLTDMREFHGSTIRLLAGQVIPEFERFMARVRAAGGLREDMDYLILMRLFISLMIGYVVTDLIAYADEQPLLPGLPASQEARARVLDILMEGAALRRPDA